MVGERLREPEPRIRLNGVEVGSHEGGHTAYFVDITKQLQRRNFLALQLNNEPGFATILGFAMRLSCGNDPDLPNDQPLRRRLTEVQNGRRSSS